MSGARSCHLIFSAASSARQSDVVLRQRGALGATSSVQFCWSQHPPSTPSVALSIQCSRPLHWLRVIIQGLKARSEVVPGLALVSGGGYHIGAELASSPFWVGQYPSVFQGMRSTPGALDAFLNTLGRWLAEVRQAVPVPGSTCDHGPKPECAIGSSAARWRFRALLVGTHVDTSQHVHCATEMSQAHRGRASSSGSCVSDAKGGWSRRWGVCVSCP